MGSNNKNWVVTVNSQGDKILSHLISGDTESEARKNANDWIKGVYGKYTDWTLHKIHCK